jgi:hypothetical protein
MEQGKQKRATDRTLIKRFAGGFSGEWEAGRHNASGISFVTDCRVYPVCLN